MAKENSLPLSIVIPTLNEMEFLPRLLGRLLSVPEIDVIVADGGSADKTAETAERMGVRVVRCCRGRGPQLNAGAAVAVGDILFFLHADAEPPFRFSEEIRTLLADPRVAAGAFRLAIDESGFHYRFIERAANFRSRIFSLPYGDQGFFLRRETFQQLGGFMDIPLMEDVDMSRRCRHLGRIVTAPGAMRVSPRRWRKEGWLSASVRNTALLGLFLAGVPARRLAFFYPPHRSDRRTE